MASIYRSAKQVVIWLGRYHEPEDDEVEFEEAFWGFNSLEPTNMKNMEVVFHLINRLAIENPVAPSNTLESPETEALLRLPPRSWAYLNILCSRKWFRRLWIVQEVFHAQSALVTCGRLEISWQLFIESTVNMTRITFRRSSTRPYLLKLNYSHVQKLKDHENPSILKLLHKLKESDASDPRDRLFALKSLLGSEEASDIEISYEKTAEIVYRDWLKKIATRTKRLDALLLASGTTEKRFPSWVPDLTRVKTDKLLFTLSNGFGDSEELRYSASGKTEANLMHSELSQDIISLQGVIIDSIAHRIKVKVDLDIPATSRSIEEWCIDCEEQVSSYFGFKLQPGVPQFQSFLDVVFRGRISYEIRFPDSLQNCYKIWRGFTPVPEDFMPGVSSFRKELYLNSAYPNGFELALSSSISEIDFFVTYKGMIGCVRKRCPVEVGDSVVVLLGANTPFILRSMGDDGENYQIQSPCYLSGYMDGQAIAAARMGELKITKINIC